VETNPYIAGLYGEIFSSASISYMPDGALQISSAPGRYLAWVLAFIIVTPLSYWCWRRRIGWHFAPAVFFASFTVPLLVVPGIALESVRVSPEVLSVRTGFWFSPTIHTIPLVHLDSIVERQEVTDPRMGTHDRFWYFRYETGDQRRLNLSDLLDANRSKITDYFREHGIPLPNA
jgi:hypothetical protein